MDAISAILVFVLVVGLVALAYASHVRVTKERAASDAKQRALDAEELANAQQELETFAAAAGENRLPVLNDQVAGVILKPSEKCVALAAGVEQIVPVKRTHYVGGSHGVSIRIAKGVTYRVGAFRGQPVTSVSEKVSDQGKLYVTDQRVVFAGGTHVTTLAVSKLANARVDRDRVILIAENKANPLVFRLAEKYRATLLAAAADLMAQTANGSRCE